MGIIWGCVAALGWGTADFMARGASRRIGAYAALFFADIVSAACLVAIMAFNPVSTVTLPALVLGTILGATNTLAGLLLYRSLAIGKLAVVSPIGSSFAAVTLVLSLLTGDSLSLIKLVGLSVTVIGVMLSSTGAESEASSDRRWIAQGVPEAIGAALTYGVTFWGLKYVVPSLGPWLPVLLSRIVALVLLPLLARPLRQSLATPTRDLWLTLAAIGVLDTAANAAYNIGIRSDTPGVVAVLGSLFSPITVLLAFVLLRERLSQRQWLGVALIFAAVAAIGIAENVVML